jgi:3-deoxy-D-manno-octulosonic-acid transferase
MLAIYSFFYFFYKLAAHGAALFDKKIQQGIEGRKEQKVRIASHYQSVAKERFRVLIHVASFGELEQAKPIIAELKKNYPNIHIHLTFFSPSGYLNAKNKYKDPDIISYLPFDDASSVNDFLEVTKPNLVIFVRYDLWPRFTLELQKRNITAILISATYRKSSVKSVPIVSNIFRSVYHSLRHIFVINADVKELLVRDGYPANTISISGDTRIDQVLQRKEASLVKGNILPQSISDKLQQEKPLVLVVGSSWEEDEKVICESIQSSRNLFTIIAPHEITESHLASLESLTGNKAIRLSKIDTYSNQHILIWDKIGDLFDLYAYGDIAYVGGGFGAGVHNVLEPAVRGIPVIVGPNHTRSVEVGILLDRRGAFVITNASEFSLAFGKLSSDANARQEAGKNAYAYIEENSGATKAIMNYLETMIPQSAS